MRKLTWLLLAVVTFGLFSPVYVLAADNDALNITTSPLPINIFAKPGEVVKTQLRVKNSGTNTEFIKVGLMKFSAFGDDGKPRLADKAVGDDYFDWVSFSEVKFKADPNVWKDITMTIAVPKSAAFGYYYAVTFARANPQLANTDKSAVLLGGTATLVLLDVKSPNAHRELELTDFQVSKKSYEFLPAKFTIKLKNVGNVHVIPTGSIYITQGSKQVEVIPVNPTKGNILPDSGRFYTADWKTGFPVYEPKVLNGATVQKNGQTDYQLSWKFNNLTNLRFGRYSAHLTMVYDDGKHDVPLDANVSFWVIPWRLIGIFIGIPLAMIGTIIYLVVSRRHYKKRSKSAPTS